MTSVEPVLAELDARRTATFRKGQWVKYEGGVSIQHAGKIGRVTGTEADLVRVCWAGDDTAITYGCFPINLIKLTPRQAAVAIATRALS